MGGYETPRRLVTTLPRASNEASSGGKTGIFCDFDFFTASDCRGSESGEVVDSYRKYGRAHGFLFPA